MARYEIRYSEEILSLLREAYLQTILLKDGAEKLPATAKANLRESIYFCNSIANVIQELLVRF